MYSRGVNRQGCRAVGLGRTRQRSCCRYTVVVLNSTRTTPPPVAPPPTDSVPSNRPPPVQYSSIKVRVSRGRTSSRRPPPSLPVENNPAHRSESSLTQPDRRRSTSAPRYMHAPSGLPVCTVNSGFMNSGAESLSCIHRLSGSVPL